MFFFFLIPEAFILNYSFLMIVLLCLKNKLIFEIKIMFTNTIIFQLTQKNEHNLGNLGLFKKFRYYNKLKKYNIVSI